MLTSFMEHTVKMPFLLFEMFDIIWQRLTMCASGLFRAPDGQICHIKKMCFPNMCNHFMRDTWTVWNATMVESGQDKRKRKTPGSFIAPKYRSLSFFFSSVTLTFFLAWYWSEWATCVIFKVSSSWSNMTGMLLERSRSSQLPKLLLLTHSINADTAYFVVGLHQSKQ